MFSAGSKAIAWPLFNFYFFFCGMIGVMMPYLSLHMKDIGFSGTQAGNIFSLITLASIIVPHFWGWLTVKLGLPKLVLQLAMLGCLLLLIPLNFVESFSLFWFLTLVFSLFYAALMPLTDSLTLSSIRSLSVPYTRLRVGGSIGYIALVTLAGAVIEHAGTKVILPMMTICAAVALFITFYIYEQPSYQNAKSQQGGFFTLLKNREIIFFLILAFLSYMAHAPFNIFFALHLSEAGYSGEQIGLLISVGVIIEIFIFLWIGNRVGQYNIIHLVALCFICGVVRWLVVAWYADMLLVAILTQLLHCITFALFHLVSIQQITRLFPDQYISQGQAMYSGIGIGLGGGVGMIGAGMLWDVSGGAWTFTAAAFVSVVALLLLFVSQKVYVAH